MKKAIVVAIGNELTEGLILDTNSKFLSSRLKVAGYRIVRIETVPDIFELVVKSVKSALEDADLVVTTGGLGPTDDDLTREAVAAATGRTLRFDESLGQRLAELALKYYGKSPEMVKKQALVIEGATVVQNTVGTAPGQLLEVGSKKLLILPGPPSELIPMFESVYDSLKTSDALYTRRVKTIGIPEAVLMDEYGGIIYSNPAVTVATMASYERGVEVRFTGPENLKSEIDELTTKLVNALGEKVYALDDDEMNDVVYKVLKQLGLRVAFAESCTGGMLSSYLVDVPGASEVFKGSVVAYSNEIKISVLGVSKDTLEKFGAVSEECVTEMAVGVRKLLDSDVAVAVSGIAGPSGGSERKPVGTVCIAVDGERGCFAETFRVRGDRAAVRRRSTLLAFNKLRLYLQGLE